ncbi:hypothetical protein PpBr36_06975 [Pyricularia pennisetigena]|uniref:hypothetical protein n=1 Tax=Pyricularia pennisetigena TaxID=1578925 RepID=UPI00114FA388|nr:hypothetical protein PpBr36_06975 [Pyricularia pennisetigena]TLS25651.1 hypothetical protein PpBr36_06975 [Pyricularia pennisetigena]
MESILILAPPTARGLQSQPAYLAFVVTCFLKTDDAWNLTTKGELLCWRTTPFAPSRNVQCRRMSRRAVVQQHPCIP